jgi:4-hydroxythreonine-4-phosphate dehydrogenase
MSKIAITLGEPSGIGVEIVCKLAQANKLTNCIVIGDENLIQRHIDTHKLTIAINHDNEGYSRIDCKHIQVNQFVEFGKLNKNNSAYVLALLDEAANGCLNGQYSAMVTCPLHKGIICDSGVEFSGHTEYLAKLSKTKKVVMMLLNEHMRVALATTHLPLNQVSRNITTKNLTEVLDVLISDMQIKFNFKDPKIAICGLNPHAGEDGHLGLEEQDTIIPLIKSYQIKNIKLDGPIPADTLFTPNKIKQYDAILAMYHDQGLAPLKYAGFGKSVNITLGLPFIRTSVDHGTALDIAGKNIASADSLLEAIKLAKQLSKVSK